MNEAQLFYETLEQKQEYALLILRIKHGRYTPLSKDDQERVLLTLCHMLTKQEALFLNEEDYLLFIRRKHPLSIITWIEDMDDHLEQIHFLHAAIGIRFLQGTDLFTICKKDAYLAMTHSQDHYKYTTTYEFFHQELLATLQKQEEMYQLLQKALLNKQFSVFFQPKLHMRTNTLAGAEALLRLHIQNQEVPLSSFLPLAKANAFIRELDLYVLEHVCEFISECQTQQLPLLPISINISPSSFMDGKFYTARVHEIISQHDIDPHLIEFELSEDIALQHSNFLYTFLNELQKQGHRISLDDFGSGYSSLLLLGDLKIDTIKLDQQFFYPPFHQRKQLLVASLIQTLHALNYQVLAEGVETKEVSEYLKSQSCDLIQGYFYHRPITQAEYRNLLNLPQSI